MQAWVVSLAINFVLGRVEKFGEAVVWDKVEADADARITAVVPAWLQGAAIAAANGAIRACRAALGDSTDLKSIATQLVAQDFGGAVTTLEGLLQKSVHADAATALEGLAVVKAAA